MTKETPHAPSASPLSDGLGEQKYEYCVICYTDEKLFKRMVEMHLEDGAGWSLVGGVSIAVQFTSVHYAQALIRKSLIGN